MSEIHRSENRWFRSDMTPKKHNGHKPRSTVSFQISTMNNTSEMLRIRVTIIVRDADMG